MTTCNEFTFFHAEIKQSEVENSFQLASDWIKSAQKNVNINQKPSHFCAPCCNVCMDKRTNDFSIISCP